jgi:hypothetical protein
MLKFRGREEKKSINDSMDNVPIGLECGIRVLREKCSHPLLLEDNN